MRKGRRISAYTIDFEPLGRRGQCRDGESFLECARRLGIAINSICGGEGTCHSCKVQVRTGTVTKPTSKELEAFSPREIRDGWRLACQTYPEGDCKLNIPPESMATLQRVQVEGIELKVHPEPPVQAYHLHLAAPSLPVPTADAERVLEALKQEYKVSCGKIDIDVLRILSERLRSGNWSCQVIIRNDEMIALIPKSSQHLGLAIDLGTTKIAGYLVDLSDGRTLAAKGFMNPQISYGEDVISRVNVAIKSPKAAKQLRKSVVEAINQLIIELCNEANTNTDEIVEAVIVGNTAMQHLLLGLPVRQLAISPFVSSVNKALDIKGRDLGLHIALGAYVHILPNIAGFVGSDHVAMLLAARVLNAEGPIVALDIGTNTEISLINKGAISTVSCASGPAFEGGHIKHGMRAAEGAIEKIQIADDGIRYQTINQAPPAGICGSGILDAISQLYLAGVIDEGGRLTNNHSLVHTYKGQREFVLVGEEKANGKTAITITQHDIRELQLAKAAIRAGIQMLLETNGYEEEDIKQVIIAGAFGSYINIASAVEIGMLPTLPLNTFRQIGNAAGMGAKLALISLSERLEAQAISSRVKYIELASNPNFNKTFIQATYLGRYKFINGFREEIK